MATKIKLMKMLQEIRGIADVTHRHPTPRHPGLFLIQLRTHVVQTTQQKRKKVISVHGIEHTDLPHPVKITHVHGPLFPLSAQAAQ